MRDLLFAVFFAVWLPLILRFPHIGAMLWAWLSFVSPDDYLYGFMTTLPLSKIVAVLTLVSLVLQRDGRKPYMDGVMMMMLGLLVIGLVSASISLTPMPFNWDICIKLAKIVVLSFVLTSVVTTRRRLQAVVAAIALGLAFNGVDEGLKVLLSGGGHHVVGVATMGDNNAFAVGMLMCVPMLLFLYQTTANAPMRWGFLLAMALCTVAVVGTYSRGGFIGLVTMAIGLIALNRNKLRNSLAVAGGGLLILLLAPASWFARIHSLGDAGQDGSFMDRVTAWKISTLVALERPLTGGGFHAIQDTRVWLHYVPGLGLLDFIETPPPRDSAMAAHSIYFEVLGDLGFAGLFFFVSMLVLGILACSKINKLSRGHADLAWMSTRAGMLRLSIIVYMVGGAALSFGYFEGIYVILATVSVTLRMLRVELAHRQATEVPHTAPAGDELWDDAGYAATT
jgi:probable O-glycosylation ligase (exosortase A-associated)